MADLNHNQLIADLPHVPVAQNTRMGKASTVVSDLSTKRMYCLLIYNVVLIILFSVLLVFLVAKGPYLSGPSNELNPSGDSPLTQPQTVLLPTLITMLIAGAAGGTLCNLRGIFKYNAQKGKFPAKFEKPFYIRPFMGAATGLFVFFLGNFINSSLSDASSQSWAYLSGRLPYVAVALLAGFVAQEFMQRLKEVGKTLFSETNDVRAAERLAELKQLLAQDLINKEDYERKYQEILNEL